MYNDKTQQFNVAPRRDMMPRNVRTGIASPVKRDIPTLDLGNGMQSRRRCDGTLRNSGEQMPEKSNCSMGKCGGWGLEARPLAMVYSPCQAWKDAYSPDIALSRGTLFAELDLPFEPSKCRKGCM